MSHREITAILIFYKETIVYCIGGHTDKVDAYTCSGVQIYSCISKVFSDLNKSFSLDLLDFSHSDLLSYQQKLSPSLEIIYYTLIILGLCYSYSSLFSTPWIHKVIWKGYLTRNHGTYRFRIPFAMLGPYLIMVF